MNFLSIDCSIDIGSLFLKVENKSFSKLLQSNRQSNDMLMKQILDFFKESNMSLENITTILVNQGPGSFSGLRGSIAVAKGICLAKNLNLFGYNTFLLSVVSFYNSDEPIYCFIKYREKYFMKKFGKKLTCLINPKTIALQDIVNEHEHTLKLVGQRDVEYIDSQILNLKKVHIVNMDYRELEFLKKKDLLQKDPIRPIYLN